MTDVKKESLTNVKFFKICSAVRKKNLWYLYNSKCQLMSNEGWTSVEVVQDYVITTSQEGKFFFHYIMENTLFSLFGNLDKIENIVDDYFIMTDQREKALYKGRSCLINYGEYKDFKLNFEFEIIVVRTADDDYELFDFTGHKLIKGAVDEVVFCPIYSNSCKLIKFLKFGKWGIYKIGKGIIIEPKMTQINVYSNYIETIIMNKKGVYSFDGEEIIPIKYSIIRLYDNKVFKIAEKKAGRYVYGALGINGVTILETEYSRVNIDLEKGTVEGEKVIRRVVKKIPR